jgi:hypothetical protein
MRQGILKLKKTQSIGDGEKSDDDKNEDGEKLNYVIKQRIKEL